MRLPVLRYGVPLKATENLAVWEMIFMLTCLNKMKFYIKC